MEPVLVLQGVRLFTERMMGCCSLRNPVSADHVPPKEVQRRSAPRGAEPLLGDD